MNELYRNFCLVSLMSYNNVVLQVSFINKYVSGLSNENAAMQSIGNIDDKNNGIRYQLNNIPYGSFCLLYMFLFCSVIFGDSSIRICLNHNLIILK